MNNAGKFVSKRHSRRIIANKTDIDIAGYSEQTSEFHNFHLQKINNKNSDIFNIHSTNETNNVHIDHTSLERENHYECNNTTQMNRDDSYNSLEDINDINENVENVNDDNDDNDDQLKNAIATWAISYNISHNACNKLLQILRQFTLHNLPKDIKTLLQTPKQTNTVSTC